MRINENIIIEDGNVYIHDLKRYIFDNKEEEINYIKEVLLPRVERTPYLFREILFIPTTILQLISKKEYENILLEYIYDNNLIYKVTSCNTSFNPITIKNSYTVLSLYIKKYHSEFLEELCEIDIYNTKTKLNKLFDFFKLCEDNINIDYIYSYFKIKSQQNIDFYNTHKSNPTIVKELLIDEIIERIPVMNYPKIRSTKSVIKAINHFIERNLSKIINGTDIYLEEYKAKRKEIFLQILERDFKEKDIKFYNKILAEYLL